MECWNNEFSAQEKLDSVGCEFPCPKFPARYPFDEAKACIVNPRNLQFLSFYETALRQFDTTQVNLIKAFL